MLEIIDDHSRPGSPPSFVIVGNDGAKGVYMGCLQVSAFHRVRLVCDRLDQSTFEVIRAYCQMHIHVLSFGGTSSSLLEGMDCGNMVTGHETEPNREILEAAGRNLAPDEDRAVSTLESEGISAPKRILFKRAAQHIVARH